MVNVLRNPGQPEALVAGILLTQGFITLQRTPSGTQRAPWRLGTDPRPWLRSGEDGSIAEVVETIGGEAPPPESLASSSRAVELLAR